ncbi:MAG: polysaccharide biosynthesis protein, partial [Oscillospiraceae bacterium]
YEELLMDEEGLTKTDNRKIFVGKPLKMNGALFFEHLETLKQEAYDNNKEKVMESLGDMVPTFNHKTNGHELDY